MKKTTRALLAPLLAFSLLLFSCANDIDSDSTTAGIDSSNDDSVTLTDNDGKSDKDTRKDGTSTSGNNNSNNNSNTTVTDFGDNFIRGFDASAVDYYETLSSGSVTYKDTDGTELDFFKILVNHGYDTVRLRIWNDPSQVIVSSDNPPTGDNTLERTISMAKRIKSAGLKLMLDFHYSDYWTDPSKQYVLRAWLTAESSDDVATLVSEYTTEVLTELKNQAEITPAYVQIGNEINSGMIRDDTTPSSTNPDFAYAGTGDTQTKYLKSASEAVRAFDDSIKIIVHVTSSNQPASLLNRLKTAELDYDIIGLSYYPWENNHGTISAMIDKVSSWKTTYSKDVIIAETSAQFADEGTSDKLTLTKTNMVDPDTSSVYSDLEMDDDSTYVKGTVANAKAVLRHIIQETYDAGGIGCFAWGGEMHGDWNRAMFDWNGKAMDNIDAFNYKPAEGYSTESGASASQNETEETEETMTLTLNFSGFTIPGGSVVVNYGADSGTYVNATGTVSDDGSSATATLSNKYANSSGWFNNITVTVKDSDENAIETEYTQYFEFSTSGKELTVSKAVSQKTFTINFSGFTIPGGTVEGLRYSTAWANSSDDWTSDTIVTPTVTVSSDGSNATFAVEQTNEFYINWAEVTVKDSSGTAVTISSGNKDTNKWYSYSGDAWSVTFVAETTSSGEGESEQETTLASSTIQLNSWNYVSAYNANAFSSYEITKIKISVALTTALSSGNFCAYAASASEWLVNLTWDDSGSNFSTTITDSDQIAKIKAGGLGFEADSTSNATVTVTITYTN